MKQALTLMLILLVTSSAIGQTIGIVDKKTKEFYIPADQKISYTVFGYRYANITTQKMICFASDVNVMMANNNTCALGSFFDTDKFKAGDKIMYQGTVGTFGKMIYVTGE